MSSAQYQLFLIQLPSSIPTQTYKAVVVERHHHRVLIKQQNPKCKDAQEIQLHGLWYPCRIYGKSFPCFLVSGTHVYNNTIIQRSMGSDDPTTIIWFIGNTLTRTLSEIDLALSIERQGWLRETLLILVQIMKILVHLSERTWFWSFTSHPAKLRVSAVRELPCVGGKCYSLRNR